MKHCDAVRRMLVVDVKQRVDEEKLIDEYKDEWSMYGK